MLEYKINDYITLKLECSFTYIYIKKKRFMHCIRLVIDIPKYDIEKYDEIDSIDETAELNKTLFQNIVLEGHNSHNISPEQEFWGHCSNIQIWIENDYDTRLLHSNIAFPLLKALVEAGEPKAREVFKEEIAIRFSSGYLPVTAYLINEGYLEFLTDDEREILISDLIKQLDQLEDYKINHQDSKIYNDIGYALNNLGFYDYAIRFLNKAIEIEPRFCHALNNLGLSFFFKNDLDKAKEYYTKAVEADQYYSNAWSNLSEIYDIEGNPSKTIEMAKKALELNPMNYEGLFFLGRGYLKNGNLYDAIEYFKQALKVDETAKKPFSLKDFRIYYTLGELYFEMEDYKKALRFSSEALKLNTTFDKAINLKYKINHKMK